MPIKAWLQSRWLDFFSLAWISIGGLWWLTFGGPAWLPILIALIAIGPGAIAGRPPFRRTPFDVLLLLFGLTALLGVWAAYDRAAAGDKFWVLALSILVYYALASQPRQNIWWVAGLVCLWGVFVSLTFLLTNDWRALPADFRIITRLGLAWTAVRPALPGQALTPNLTAGILAGLFPFTLALGLAAWQPKTVLKNRWLTVAGSVFSAGLLSLTIFMTSSRGAWLALAAGLVFWLAWWGVEKLLAAQPGRRTLLLALGGGILTLVAIGALVALPGGLTRILNLAPGLPTGQSRLGIDRLALHLVGDYPLTGGGLGAFAGLFSQYMLVIPHVMFTYSHNLYLDVALEQGLPGLALLLSVLLGSAVLLLRAPITDGEVSSSKPLRQAALASLVIMILHGLVDDPFYGERATPFLWIIPGMAVFLHPQAKSLGDVFCIGQGGRRSLRVAFWLVAGLLLAVAVSLLVYGPKRLAASWMANLGAVQMAQVQLSHFPNNEWQGSQDLARLAPAQEWLERAVRLDPSNRTANHRLGLIALQREDFAGAIRYLQVALDQDPAHRGVIKNLGYAYAWAGQYEQAQTLLAQIPEAKQELRTYVWWWQAQGRADLAQYAEQMRTWLAGGTSLLPRPHVAVQLDPLDMSSIR